MHFGHVWKKVGRKCIAKSVGYFLYDFLDKKNKYTVSSVTPKNLKSLD
jgi:hypothetical protein